MTDTEWARFEHMIEYYGGHHEQQCPGDDTCECAYKPYNDGINEYHQRADANIIAQVRNDKFITSTEAALLRAIDRRDAVINYLSLQDPLDAAV